MNLLLVSWPVEPRQMRKHIPRDLEVDTLEGRAWVSVVVSRVAGARPTWLPPLPWVTNFLSVGVRTCVRHGADTGIFFSSIDTERVWAASLGRSLLHLPCYRARIQLNRSELLSRLSCVRRHQGVPPAAMHCEWHARMTPEKPRSAGLRAFLDNRHQIFTWHEGSLLSGVLWHSPVAWRDASLEVLDCSLLEAAGLPAPEAAPVAHEADARAIEVWPMRLVRTDTADDAILEPALAPPPAG